ncbi:class GN sortase [Inquilinus sp. Marseille-Q2685]|uniref:class GN sortase n=1 Tax=Inquilinus sp. Marseille-Q2685 TaxID=2866581 RepID=UPI001CE4933C|nr:class GN sortase [Inquilinus sp. Marseille-Q2685]
MSATLPLSHPLAGERLPRRQNLPRQRRSRSRFVALLLVLAGLVLAGQGVWIHAKAMLAQVLLDRAFAETLATGRSVKPWPWADTWPVARIELPRLGESAIALAGASGQALAFGPGHVQDTPEAGDPGTAVYAAHRDTHFRVLRDVKVGDEIAVTRRDGRRVTFKVTGTRVATWDVSGIDPRAPGRNLVLATCWPFDATTRGPYRYLVEAEEVAAGTAVADAATAPRR